MKKYKDRAIIVNGRIHSLFVSAIKYFSLLFLFTSPLLAENVNLFWTANSEPDVVSYNVKRGDVSGGPYTTIGSVGQTANPSFTDVSVDLGTDKFYVVTAINNAALESPNSNEATAASIPPGVPPNSPTITITITVSP